MRASGVPGYTRAPAAYTTSTQAGRSCTHATVSASVASVSPGRPKMRPSSSVIPCSTTRATVASRWRRRKGLPFRASTSSTAESTVIETVPFVAAISRHSSSGSGVGLK